MPPRRSRTARGGGRLVPAFLLAPSASPHIERFVRTLREEALDHFIFLSADHVHRVAAE